MATYDKVMTEAIGPEEGAGHLVKQAALVIAGVLLLTLAAKIRVPFWPVPMTMGTFAVLTIGAAYGMRLGVITLLAYLAVGAIGMDVFASSSAENNGLAYMAGPTGGYLVGYVVAAAVVGAFARAGWDRSPVKFFGALLIGNAIIYAFGMPWMIHLFLEDKGWAWVTQWGMTNFLVGDLLKLFLAALLIPTAWNLIGRARS
ncbi:MAG: biotin transporter BioY [Pseudomonadota bacterium]